jgi:predicted AlkP superfamily phosphohydrolase/phosphomutase
MKNRNRVLVIGLDGATWNVLNPLIERGLLPNLAQLKYKGAYGTLKSTIPPHTSAAWVSAVTGVGPGKHGIFDFTNNLNQGPQLSFYNSSHIKVPTIWQLLSQAGLKVGAINVPMTYPAQQVNGIMIAGMMTPSKEDLKFTYPPELRRELRDYDIDIDISLANNDYNKIFQKLKKVVQQRTDVALKLLRREAFDFFMIVYTDTDRLHHKFYKSWVEGNRETLIYKNFVEFYSALDKQIGKIIKTCPEFNYVLILSDHGFTHLKKYFFINKYLEDMGLLNFRSGRDTGKLILNNVKSSIKKLDLFGIRNRSLVKSLYSRIAVRFEEEMPNNSRELSIMDIINWEKTKAYVATRSSRGVYVNLKGRNSQGVVKTKHYENLLQRIIDILQDAKDPETGNNKVFKLVKRREEVFGGSELVNAPDVMYLCSDGYGILEQYSPVLFEKATHETGWHSEDGVITICGEFIKKDFAINKASILDIVPTILYIYSLPLLENMDGTVLKDIFDETYLKNHKISLLHSHSNTHNYQKMKSEDFEVIKTRLKNLGYF